MNSLALKSNPPTYGTIPCGESFKIEHLKKILALQFLKKGYKLLAISRKGNGELHPVYVHETLNENLDIDGKYEIQRWFEIFGCDIGYDEDGWRYQLTVTDNSDFYQEYTVYKYKLKESQSGSL